MNWAQAMAVLDIAQIRNWDVEVQPVDADHTIWRVVIKSAKSEDGYWA